MTREQWLKQRVAEIGDEYRRAYHASVAPFMSELEEIERRKVFKIILDKPTSIMVGSSKVEDGS